ncbi:MAG TPA: hypothetical protein PK385_04085 [Spirochaetota bacterium]|nr:hypothetical protein [Spirochaetota bacterium]HOS33293.1 hypothetical protein [Spirochaetota bacterium]HOS55218.1 hypothetical protein [Spirochaetota bacterium]HPK62823.1 hypothetical protein [Spirochaetota bacterium]HQF78571.1 hypothetical protein [Spirochaetota bacterium]
MTTNVIDEIVNELKDFPNEKANSLLDYLHFLKYEDKVKEEHNIPNETTLQTFKDTDEGKKLNICKNADDMFNRLGI